MAYLVCDEPGAERVELLADEGDTVIDPFGDIDLGPHAHGVISGRGGTWTLAQPDAGPVIVGALVGAGVLHHGALLKIGAATARFGVGDPARALADDRYLRATTDGLTGLLTRRVLLISLARLSPPGAVLAIDLDMFKRINDQHGMLVGDTVLGEVAARIRTQMQWPELAARYGGEEFAVVLPGASVETARVRAEAIRVACEASIVADGESVIATVSIGVAPLTSGLDSLRAAEARLVVAKQSGRNRVVG